MKRLSFKSKYKHRASIEITPLIDLVFLLLVFFMVTSSLGTVSSITVHLPKAVQTGKQVTSNLVISIDKKNGVHLNDKEYKDSDILEEIKKRKDEIKDSIVVIRADKSSNYETIIKVIDYLNRAGIPRFTLATVKAK